MATILLPVVLMLPGSWAGVLAAPGSLANRATALAGQCRYRLLVAVLVSFVTLGKMRGFSRETILKFSNECLAPTANITLVIGAGGGFGRILQDSGVSQAIVAVALHAHVSLLLLGWLVAALIRLATGSATVALTTAAGIVAPILLHSPGVRPGVAGHRHGRGIAHLLPCQRWRLLAGEGVLQHERGRYHEDLVHQRNHDLDHRPAVHARIGRGYLIGITDGNSRPEPVRIQIALKSYWSHKTVAQAQLA